MSKKKTKKKTKNKQWLQKAIKRPGRVREYLIRKYGKDAALTRTGEVNHRAVQRAIRELKQKPKSQRPKGLLSALQLAKRLELRRKDKKGGR